jgi:hypothetical protein
MERCLGELSKMSLVREEKGVGVDRVQLSVMFCCVDLMPADLGWLGRASQFVMGLAGPSSQAQRSV